MSLAPVLDLRSPDDLHPNDPAADVRDALPANIEAEQALLGAVMCDNSVFHLLEDVRETDFQEPLHGRLWTAIATNVGRGMLAEPVTLLDSFKGDPAFEGLGGIAYLADMVAYAPPATNAPDYARVLRKLALRRELVALGRAVSRAAMEDNDEAAPEEIIGLAESSLLAMQVTSRKMEPVTAGSAAARVLARLDAPAEEAQGITTGLEPLDEELGPLQPGNLILGFARPSMGKSATSENIAHNVAAAGYGVIVVNVEMDEMEMAERHLADICHRHWGNRGPEYRDIRRRRVSQDQRRMLDKARQELERLPLVMLRRPGIKLSQLRSLCRRQKAAWARQGIPLGMVVVDHFGRVQPDERVKDRYTAQALVSAASKELASELECPMVALLQMSRANEARDEKRPQLSDIRDAGTWEEDADIAIGFYRDAYYAQRRPEPKKDLDWAEWDAAKRSRTVEAIILKARAGSCSTVKLWGDVARNAIRGHAPEGELL